MPGAKELIMYSKCTVQGKKNYWCLKHGKKKGGIKTPAVTRYDEWVPCFVDYISAATHDI